MNPAGNGWTISLLCAVVILFATFAIDPFSKNSPVDSRDQTGAAGEQEVGTVNLSSTLADGSLKKGAEASVDILLDSPKGNVSGAEIHLTYDPKVLSVKKVEPGDFFQNPTVLQQEIDNKAGKVLYTVGTLTPVSGKGVAARVRVAVLSLGDSKLSISKDSKVAAVGSSKNVLGEVSSAQLVAQ